MIVQIKGKETSVVLVLYNRIMISLLIAIYLLPLLDAMLLKEKIRHLSRKLQTICF